MAFTRTSADLIGSPASPATVNTNSNSLNGVYDLTNAAGQVSATFVAHLIAGATAPTQAIVVKWEASLNGTNYAVDQTQSVTLTNGTASDAWYTPADPVQKVKCTVTNPDSAQAITCWVEGASLVA